MIAPRRPRGGVQVAAGPAQGAKVRTEAARAIAAVRFDGASLKAVLPAALEALADARDRALCEAICFEAARWCLRYEGMLAHLLERPLPKAARQVHALLLAGLAQLDAMRLADYAAISSTAEAARLLKQPGHVGLVNAVLRRYTRERAVFDAAFAPAPRASDDASAGARDSVEHAHTSARQAIDAQPAPVDERSSSTTLSALANDEQARTAHPSWLVQTLRRDWADLADALFAANNEAAPLWLRVNLAHGTREDYRERLIAAGFEAQTGELLPSALRLERGVAPTRLPGWDDGLVSVQDVSAQLTAHAVDARDGLRVLDACAAPGGKTAHLLERHDLRLLALDVDAARLQRVQANLARLKLDADTRAADAAQPNDWWDGTPFDRILLDAPCSGTGVIRRQPDIKLHRRAGDIAGLVALQARLLDAAWPMLARGGRLVYATCSVLKDENERQIDAFLARTPDAHALALPEVFGRAAGGGRQRLPGDDGGDGFFHAALEKRG